MNQNNLKLAIQLRHELHSNPELSYREHWTKKHLMNFLRNNTRLELVDRDKWFYAIYHAGKDKPNIAFRADFDAVAIDETISIPWKSKFPGIAHKCGHDGHSAAMAAFALEVDQGGADKNIFFLFQHAEETAAGAIECQTFIPEHNISEIFAFHNSPGLPCALVSARAGTTNCASTGMRISFAGLPSHASEPESGRNPAFAIAELVQAIPGLTGPDKWQDLVMVTVVGIKVGEDAFGISPGDGVLNLTCRAVHEAQMNILTDKIRILSKELADRFDLGVSFEFVEYFPETVAHAASVDKVKSVCESMGIPFLESDEPSRGSEDFGYYTKLIPGAMFLLGAGEGPPIHTKDYDFNDALIETAVELYKGLAGIYSIHA